MEWEPAPTPPAPPWSGGSGGERQHRLRMCVVYMLCDAGVEVNAVDGWGLTPLHYAARRGGCVDGGRGGECLSGRKVDVCVDARK